MQGHLRGEHFPVNSWPGRTLNKTVGGYYCWFPTSTKWCDNHKTQINQAGTELEASSLLADPHRPRRYHAGCGKSGRVLGSLTHLLGSWARPGSCCCCCCFAPCMGSTHQMAVYKLSIQRSRPLWSEKLLCSEQSLRTGSCVVKRIQGGDPGALGSSRAASN